MMVTARAYAKFNLNLHIIPDLVKKKESGYFPVSFVNCELTLHDEIRCEKVPETIAVECNDNTLDTPQNFMVKTAQVLKEIISNKSLGVHLKLDKHIPVCGGLGGGSSDAACALKLLTKMWNIQLSTQETAYIISKIGSDMFYSMEGGLCEIEGIGDKVQPIPFVMPRLYMLLVIPKFPKPSTKHMYDRLDMGYIGTHLEKKKKLLQGIKNKNKPLVIQSLHNDFEASVFKEFPDLLPIRRDILNAGADNVLLAGSGLTLAGVFADKVKSEHAFYQLKKRYETIWTQTK